MPVEWVGHPLLDLTPPRNRARPSSRATGSIPQRPVVALLPGSRRNELRAILPDLVRARRPRSAIGVPAAQFVVARAPHLDDELFAPLSIGWDRAPVAIVEGETDDVLAARTWRSSRPAP